MIAADTNVLLRFVVKDDAGQYTKAFSLIAKQSRRGERIFIPLVVAAEFVWALSSVYRYTRAEASKFIAAFLQSHDFKFEKEDIVKEALAHFQKGRIDFADALIALCARDAGCSATHSFDKAFVASNLAKPV